MEIIKLGTPNSITEAIKILRKGGIIIYPTETCYGVGVDATSTIAVSKLLKYKKRPEGKAISIGCTSQKMASKYVEINKTAENLYENFLPGPVTIISKSKKKVDKRLESENGNLGIRISSHPYITNVIRLLGTPVTTTSANSAGKKTPYSIDDILENLSQNQKEMIDLIIDAGELPKNLASTVIDTTTEDLRTYRYGAINLEDHSNAKETISRSVNETIKLAENIINKNIHVLKDKSLVFLLRGELGAGKTHFTKGIAKALGITRTIKSPTYTYVDEYLIPDKIDNREKKIENSSNLQSTIHKLYHIDAWRVDNKGDLDALGFVNWLKPGNVLVVEWPDIIFNLLGKDIFGSAKIINVELKDEGEFRRIRIM
jgi:L-threonylcarbamoyladenylate synthase